MKCNYFLFLIFILLTTILNAQIISDDNSQYFDDGGLSSASNILEFNILSAANGDIGISYDRKISDLFSVEIGIGFISPFYTYEYFEPLWKKSDIPNSLTGYSFKIEPKYYLLQGAPEFSYIGIMFRHRHYRMRSEANNITDICFMYGFRFITSKNLTLGLEIGSGFRSKRSSDSDNASLELFDYIVIPASLKIGYIF